MSLPTTRLSARIGGLRGPSGSDGSDGADGDDGLMAAASAAEQDAGVTDEKAITPEGLARRIDMTRHIEGVPHYFPTKGLTPFIDEDGVYSGPLSMVGQGGLSAEYDPRARAMVISAGAQHLFGGSYIREIQRFRELRRQGVAGVHHVAFAPADSYTRSRDWAKFMARRWKAEMGNGGPGWCGVGFPGYLDAGSNASKAADAIGNVDSSELSIAFYGGSSWTGQYTTVVGSPDKSAVTSSTAGAGITFTYNGSDNITAVKAFWIGGSGVSRYRFNGGSWTTLNLSGSGGQTGSLSGMPAGAFTLDWEVVSGACQICGVSMLTGLSGVVVHNLANNGSALYHWARSINSTPAADRAAHAAILAQLGAIRTFISPIGPNDQTSSRTSEEFEADILAYIDEVMEVVSPGCDKIWVAAPENGRSTITYPVPMSDYRDAMMRVSKVREIAVIDMQPKFGASYAEYGHAGTKRVLFNADLLHPETPGFAAYGATIDNALTYGS